jgi:N-acyl-D-amino-acid deacylase
MKRLSPKGTNIKKRSTADMGRIDRFLLAVFPLLMLLTNALAAPDYNAKQDDDGCRFIVEISSEGQAENASILKRELKLCFTAEQSGSHLLLFESLEPGALADRILSLPSSQSKKLRGIMEIRLEAALESAASALIEVYHYPFGAIAEEHIRSPQYSFKFGSDSALLAIRLHEALSVEGEEQTVFADPEIAPAAAANPYLPRDLLRKSTRLTLRFGKNLSEVTMKRLAAKVYEAAAALHRDKGSYVMGMLSDKAQKHARAETIEIRVFKYLYPNRKFSDKEIAKRKKETSKPIRIVKPFSSNLYYVSGLARLSPYSFEVIDASRNENDYWREVDKGDFLTSSLRGVVRTVPCRLEKYVPLKSRCQTPKNAAPRAATMDYVIESSTVFDGSKDGIRFVADVGIAGERIASVGNLKQTPRRITIDGRGLFLTPGFIDIHSHGVRAILKTPRAPSHIRQGITTILGGNCGFSPLAMGSFLAEMEKGGPVLNVGLLLGNRPVRKRVLGRRTPPSYNEVYRQKELVDLAMEEGAFGFSTGLIYEFSKEAFVWELAEICKQLKPYGGIYASHVRGEAEQALDAIREAIYIGEIAEVPVQISHVKIFYKENWGGMERYLGIMKSARARGVDVTGDQYPWRAAGRSYNHSLYDILIRHAIAEESPENVVLKNMPDKYAKYSRRPLTELLEGEKLTPQELLADLKLTKQSPFKATAFVIGDEDMCLAMKQDFIMVCTDAKVASLKQIEGGKCRDDHPRDYRTYPEFFARYVRDRGVCSWELGVYKCTGLPAERMGLPGRGSIRPGAYADLVLFDPERIDPGTGYMNQAIPPKGIGWVFINGFPALREGKLTKSCAGKVLRAGGRCKP